MPRALAPLTVFALALVALSAGVMVLTEDEGTREAVAAPALRASAERESPRRERHRLGSVDASGPVEAATGPAPAEAPSVRELRVRTESGSPVPGCVLHWSVEDGEGGTAVADTDGRTTVAAPDDAGLTVRIGTSDTPHAVGGDGLVVVPDAKRIELVAIDSRTDERVGRVAVGAGDDRIETGYVLRTDGVTGDLSAELPEGLVLCPDATSSVRHAREACRVAAGYRLVLPTRPEVIVPVFVTGGDVEQPPEVAVYRSDTREPRIVRVERAEGGDWVGQARGIPYLRGEWIGAYARQGDREAFEASPLAAAGLQPGFTLKLEPLRKDLEPPQWPSRWLSTGCGCGFAEVTGTLVVRAFHRDGRPASGIRLSRGGDTDARGELRIARIGVGNGYIAFREPGVVPTGVSFVIREGETTVVELRERAGRTIELDVQAEDGTPLPYARVDVDQPSGVRYVRLDAARIADAELYTDSQGRITLPNLQETAIRLTVHYGSRSANGRVSTAKNHAVAVLPDALPLPHPRALELEPVEVDSGRPRDAEW